MKRLLSSKKRKAISRVAIVAIVIVILVIAGGAAYYFGLSKGPGPSTQNKGTITVGTTDTVQTTLDPADAYDYFGINVIQNVGDGLVDYIPGTTQLTPALATSWTTSTDGLTWTFTLRQGVKFADGTPFNASVVQYSMDRQFKIAEPEGPFEGVGYDGFTGGFINKTVVTGPYTIQFVLNQPFSAFLSTVAFIPLYPVNPNIAPKSAIVNYTDGNAVASNPTGLGPYQLSKWVRSAGKDVEIDLTANPNYWNKSANWPATQNITIKFYSDSTSLLLALQNGDIDVAYRQLDASQINSLTGNAKYKVWTGPGTFIQYMVINTKASPFNNVLVREGLAAAVNRSLLTNGVFQGQAQALYSMIPAGMFSHTDAFQTQFGEANLTAAQQFLTQAGYSSSNKLTFTLTYPTGHYTSTDAIAGALKQAFEATGMVSVNLASQPWANYKASTASNALQVYIYGWYPDYVDPYDYTYPFLPPDGVGFLHTQFVDTQINSLLTQVVSTTSTSQQQTLYQQLQTRIAQTVPMVPLFQGTSVAISTPKVSGIVLDATTIFRYWLLSATS
jgi:peptide/nickel transport system substrate-binding protein